MLAFWTGDDEARIERLMNASALGKRGKWTDRADYREPTISNAIAAQTEFYDPTRPAQTRKGRISADPAADAERRGGGGAGQTRDHLRKRKPDGGA